MSKSEFNSTIHAPNRLQICALLSETAKLEFKVVKAQLYVSDSVLSKHIKVLQEGGYVELTKTVESGRNNTWLSLTQLGHMAFTLHVNALKEIVG